METITLQTIQWSTLLDIDAVAPIGSEDHQVLKELRAVILKHKYENRFGVALLHKHFELDAGEVLMEKTDVERRTSTLTPQPADAHADANVIETLWRFGQGESPDGVTVCVSRCDYNRGHKSNHHREGR